MKINKITGLIKATLGDVSTALAYDDMLGEVRSSITGATSWNTAQINDTGFLLGWLRNNSSDYFQLKIQCPHRRKRESTLADIHIHYCTQTAFWSILATIAIVVFMILFPKIASPQNTEWRKPDVTSQEHFLAGTMISYTGGYILEQGLNMRYGYEVGLIAGGLAGYLKERSDPVFDLTDLSFTVVGSVAGFYINRGIQKWYGLSDYEKVLKKINRLEKQAEKMRNNANTRRNIIRNYQHRRKMGDG